MDHEVDQMMLDLANKASQMFLDFMTKIAQFEEMVDVGNRLLRGFYQALELFRRPSLLKTSKVVDDIIEANNSVRMKAYVEAGYRHDHIDVQNANDWKVEVLLVELEYLVKDVICLMQTAYKSTDHLFGDCVMHEADYLEKEEAKFPGEAVHDQCEMILYRATLMRLIYNMVKLDYAMQEKICRPLNLNTSSEELESFCAMWDLRPFIDDKVMLEGWRLVPDIR